MAAKEHMRGLLLAIGGLSLVDLAVTLTYMKTMGLYEANPIVRLLAASASPVFAIVLFKCATVAVAIALLHRLRRFTSARVMAAAMVAVLVWVSVQWVRYGAVTAEVPCMTASAETILGPGGPGTAEPGPGPGPGWVRLD